MITVMRLLLSLACIRSIIFLYNYKQVLCCARAHEHCQLLFAVRSYHHIYMHCVGDSLQAYTVVGGDPASSTPQNYRADSKDLVYESDPSGMGEASASWNRVLDRIDPDGLLKGSVCLSVCATMKELLRLFCMYPITSHHHIIRI